jgi:hypothetical protein
MQAKSPLALPSEIPTSLNNKDMGVEDDDAGKDKDKK